MLRKRGKGYSKKKKKNKGGDIKENQLGAGAKRLEARKSTHFPNDDHKGDGPK